MSNPIFKQIKRYLATDSEFGSRPSQILCSPGRWLDVRWESWDDRWASKGFLFRTGHAYDFVDAGERGGSYTKLRVTEVVNSQNNRLLDLQIEPLHWEFW